MIAKRLAKILGIVVASLAVIGLLGGEGQAFGGLLNIDAVLDILRIPIAAALLYAGFGSNDERTIHNIVLWVGILYVGMALLGMFTPALGGLLPHHLTGFDIFFHLVTGIMALLAGMSHADTRNTATA